MANITLTNLPTVTGLNGTEPLLGVQNSTSVQITTGQIVSLSRGGGGISPLPVIAGGTGDATLTSFGILYGNGTSPVGTVTPPTGTNYVLVGSAGSAPTWQPTIPVTAGVDSVSFGTTGLTPSTDTAGVITVAGTLVAANGGTGQSSYTIGDLLYASSSTALSKLADVATGSVLISGGVGAAPSYSSSPTISGTTTSGFFIANGTITGSRSQGAYAYGTLGYSDINIYASFASSVNNYTQIVVQNTNAGASASTNILVSNNLGTASTYFGEFGMNSSGFTGTGAFNAASTVYLDATSADLAIGTTTANAIHFVVNGGATDAATISSAGVFSLGTALAVSSGGTGAGTFTANGVIYGNTTSALGVTAAGTTGQVLVATTSGAPSWGAIPSTAAVTSISFGTTGLTPSTATTGAVTVAGTLVAANGGTGQSLYAVGDLLYASTTTALSKLADVATGSVLVSGGVGVAPAYSASPTLTTSLTTPLVIGGTAASSTLTLESTSGVGTTDSIIFKTGSQSTRMTIDTSGQVGIGTSTSTGVNLLTNALITGATSAYAHLNSGVVQSGVTSGAFGYASQISLAAAAFTTTNAIHFNASPNAGGAGSTISNQFGFNAESTLGTAGAATVTNAYGFYGNIAAATNRWNLYMGGTALNYMAGNLGIGATATTSTGISLGNTLPSGANSSATSVFANNIVTATNTAAGFQSSLYLSGAVYTQTNQIHFWANPTTVVAAGTITNQYGFVADSGIGTNGTAAGTITNAYGFLSNMGSGTNRFALYLASTANSYLGGYSFGLGGVMATTTSTATNTVTLTATQVASGFIVGTPTATASYTLPLASALDTELTNAATGYNFEIVVFTTAAFAITLLTNTGWTLVGSMATGATANSFARFRARKTGVATYSLYRIS
jgi:hypothetical protein